MGSWKRFWTTKRINITVVVVAVLVVVGCLVAVTVQHRSRTAYATAIASCSQTASTLESTAKQYDDLLKHGAADAAKITKDQVDDDATIAALTSAMMPSAPKVESCTATSVKDADAQADELKGTLDWYTTHLSALQTAVDNVQKSQKTLADAKSTLQQSRDAAQTVYDDSLWQVSDESVRTELATLIDQADSMLADGSDAKAADMTALADKLDGHAKAVTDNQTAYMDTTGSVDTGVAADAGATAGLDAGTMAGTDAGVGTDGTLAGTTDAGTAGGTGTGADAGTGLY